MLVNGLDRVNHFIAQGVSYIVGFLCGSEPLHENYYTGKVISRKDKLRYGRTRTRGSIWNLSKIILGLRQHFLQQGEETAHMQPIHQSVMHFYGDRQASNVAISQELTESNSRY
jgi:hypothetical protein